MSILSFFCLLLPIVGTNKPQNSTDEVRVTGKRVRPESPRQERTLFSMTLPITEMLTSGRWLGSELARRSPAVGIRASGGDLQSGYLLIRGASPVQTMYFLDGLPMPAGFGGLLDAAGLPAAGLSSVELFRGAVPAEFGPNAAAGAINLVPLNNPPGLDFRIYDTRGSFGTWKLSLFGGVATQNHSASGAFSYATTLGNYPYFSNGGTIYTSTDDGVRNRENNHVAQMQAIGTASRVFTWGRFRTVWMLGQRRAGVAGPHSIVTRFTHHERTRLRMQLTTETWAGRSDAYAETIREHYHDPYGELGVGSSNDLHDFTFTGLRHRFLHNFKKHETALIAHIFSEHWNPKRLTFGRPNQRTRLSAWLSGRLRFRFSNVDFLTVFHGAAVRPDPQPIHVSPIGEPLVTPKTHGHIGGFMGVFWRATHSLHMKANVARAFREPAFSELYGDFGVVKGNAALRPEQAWNVDAGFHWDYHVEPAKVTVEAAIFGRRVENLIQYIPNSQFVSLPINVGAARFSGIETGIQSTFFNNVSVRAQTTFLHTRNNSGLTESDGNPLPGRPQWMFSAALGYTSVLYTQHRAIFEISWTHQRGGYFDLAARRPMPQRHSLDIQLSWQFPHQTATLSLDIRNLTNTLWTHVERLPTPPTGPIEHPQAICDQLGYPIPGRSVFLTLSVTPLHKNKGGW